MRAVPISRVGPPESLRAETLPAPSPGPGQVRIRVRRAGVNFADVLARQGVYPDAPAMPFVPGYEVAGVVDEVGSGVSGFRGGERVAAFTRFGGYAEWVVASAAFTVPLPDGVDDATGAAIPVNGVTAYHSLFHTGTLFPGDRVLIHAAAGGVGLAAVQMARNAGAVVFGTAGSPGKIELLRGYGVDYPIDYMARDFVEAVREATGGEGVDVVLDSVGGEMIDRDFRVLRPGGRVVSIGLSVVAGKNRGVVLRELSRAPRLSPIRLLEQSHGFVGVNLLRAFEFHPALGTLLLRQVVDLVASGKVRPFVSAEFPLERAGEAHALLEGRSTVGKVLLSVDAS